MRCPTCHHRIATVCPTHGASAAANPLAPLAAWPGVDGLSPRVVLGGGGGGTVWGCVDRKGKRVAVKIATNREAPRLHREIEAQRRLGAPTAPRLIARTLTADGRIAIVMEWLEGETLAARLADLAGRWPVDSLAQLTTALAERIDTVHAAGLAHRDLKPENIWIEPTRTVRLLDFGLAWVELAADEDWRGTCGDVVGTPYYMAPEQARGEPSGASADIYSYGAIVFELLAGRPPFVGGDVRVAHASRRAPALSTLAPHLAILDGVVARCLAKRPEARPQTAGEVAKEIANGFARAWHVTEPGTTRRKDHAAAQRPVALLGIPAAALELQAVAAATTTVGGVVARASSDGFVIAFPGVPPARGLTQARELAARLGVEARLHVAELAIRTGVRGVRVSGAAIDDTSAWWMAVGGITTAASAFAAESHDDTLPAAPSDEQQRVTLIGRARELETIVDSALTALASGQPTVITIVGDAGVGKTRLLEEAAAAIATREPKAASALVAIDDAHRLDVAVLEGLEHPASNAPYVVIAAAQPALYQRRPLWGDHATMACRIELAPLESEQMFALLRALLAPVEYVAEPALATLSELAHGIPAHAVEVVQQLRAAGAIRHSTGGAAFLAADELLHVSATGLATRLAERVLAELAPDVRCFARIAAILGEDITASRLDAVRIASGHVDVDLDAGVALARLVAEQIVVERDRRYELRTTLLRDAIVDAIAPGERAELHRAALASLATNELNARARHAQGAGELALAAVTLVALGDHHRDARRDVEAERAYSAALEFACAGPSQLRALVGRAKVRYRFQRLADADADLALAEPLAREPGLLADVKLERATVADWSEQFAHAAALVAAAEPLVVVSGDPVLATRLQMARGRAAFRTGDLEAARENLTAAARDGDAETAIIARIMLGAALVASDELDNAELVLDEVVASAAAAGDRLHHCSALNNRMWVWIKRNDLDHAIADQRAATELARMLGHPHLERCCTYNLAELLHWRGCADEALPLVHRSRSLQQRFLGPSPLDALLLARVQAARGQLAEAAIELAWIDATCGVLDPASAMQRELIGLVASKIADRESWERVLDAARATTVLYELHEALWFATRAALRGGDAVTASRWLAEARSVACRDLAWTARFDLLAATGGL
ncbi:MAG TPA: protein kinase [Kofleriaceae bacterium]